MKRFSLRFYPIFVIFFLWLLLSVPYFLFNKVPYSSTYQVNHFPPWSVYSQFWGPVKNGAMPDISDQIYPWRYLSIQTWKNGQVPLWNPYSFSGTPHLANYQSSALSPMNVLFFVLPYVTAWSLLVLLQPLLAGLFMYFFLRTLLFKKYGALIGAISFMFCGFLTVWRDYGTLGYAILFLPFALFFVGKFFITRRMRYVVGLSVTIPLSFLSGHFQTSLYFLIVVLCYLLYTYVKTKRLSLLLISASFILFGIFLSLPQILPTAEFYSQSYRSGLYQADGGIPWNYITTLIAPDFFGNPVTRNDWFGFYAEWNGFIGVLPLFFVLFSFTQRKAKQYMFFLVGALVSLLLAYDTPLVNLLVSLRVPVLSTSATNRIIVLFSFFASVLAVFGFEGVVNDLKQQRRKKLLVWIISCMTLFIVLWMIIFVFHFVPQDRIGIAKNNMLLPTAILALFVALFFLGWLKKRLLYVFVVGVITITSFDMMRFTTKWEPSDPASLVYPDVGVTELIKSIEKKERAIGNFGAETGVYYGIGALGGYDALYIRRYGEFVSFIGDGNYLDLERSIVQFPKDGARLNAVLRLLGVKYVIHKVSDTGKGWTFQFWNYPADQFTRVFSDGIYEVFINNTVYARTFLVGKERVITDEQKILSTLFDSEFDPKQEVILEEEVNHVTESGDAGSVAITQYSPNKIIFQVNAKKNSMLFLSDPYYPGWKVFVNGVEKPIYRANFAFRAVPVEKGSYVVTMTYDPVSFKAGLFFALVGILGILSPFFLRRKYI